MGRPDATEAEVEAAAKAANIHDFVDDAAAGLPDRHRREGHQALGRPAPARRHRPRAAARHAHPGAGRGAVGGRRRERGGDPGGARPADARAHDPDPRPPALQRHRLRPHPRARGRPRRRERPARGAHEDGRRLCPPDGRAGPRIRGLRHHRRRAREPHDRGDRRSARWRRQAGDRRHHQGGGIELAAAHRRADEGWSCPGRAGSPPPSSSACCACSPSSASAC